MAHNQKGAGAPLLAVSAGLAILAYSLGLRAEKGYMILVAKDTQEHPIQGVQLGVEGIGSIRLTGSDGKVRIRLGSAAEEGDSVSLILQSSPKGKDYVILSPWNRRLRIPKFDEKPDNFVEVILVERGDRAMLESGKALRSITLQINSTNAKDLTSEQTAQPDPRTALNIVAKQYGLAPEDVDKAVKWWASTSTDEFDRGLAAYYARRFQEAGDEFRSSLKESENQIARDRDSAGNAAYFLGMSLYSQGKYREAADALNRAQEFRPDDLDIIYARVKSLADAGELAEADKVCDRELALAQKTLQPDDPALASAFDNKGQLLVSNGKSAEAEALFEKAIAIDRKTTGPIGRHNLASSLNSLGLSLESQRKYVEAQTAYDKAIAIQDGLLGPDNLDSAMFRNNRALLLEETGRNREAQRDFLRVLALREELEGPDHPDLGTTLYGMARSLENEHRYREAEPYARRLAGIDGEFLAPDSPRIASDLLELGMILKFNSKYLEAEVDLARAMKIYRTLAGEKSLGYGRALDEHALVLMHMKELPEAEEEARQAAKIFDKELPNSDTHVALGWEGLAIILSDEGKDSEAQDSFRKALDRAVNGLGPANHITKRIETELKSVPN